MTPEIALWAFGLGVVPALTWAVAVIWLLRDIKKTTDTLVVIAKGSRQELHSHIVTENEGFNDMARSLKALVHYVKWTAQEQTGKEPPPPVDLGRP